MDQTNLSLEQKKIPLSRQIELYIESMTSTEKKAYIIAKSHLGSSFQIEKSIGFLAFIRTLNQG
jgi:hypothetical protein